MTGSFSKNSLITFLAEIAIFIFGFATLIMITRGLGPEGKGIYSLILLVPSLLLSFGGFGIGASNVYFAGNKKFKIEDVVSNSIVSALILGVFLVALFWFLLQFSFFKEIIHADQIPYFYLWIVIFSIPVSLLFGFFQNIIRGRGYIWDYNKARLAENILGFIAVFLFLIVLKYGLAGAIFAYIFALAGAALFTIILVSKISEFIFCFNWELFKESFIYGGKVYLANTISFMSYRLDMFLIAALLSGASAVAAVGFYSIAVSVAEKLFIIPGALSTVLFPKISSSTHSEANDFTPKVIRHTLFIVLICSIILALFSYPLITIVFGNNFAPSVLPMVLLLPGIIAFSVGGVIAADLSGRGKPQFAIYSSITCVAVNIILNILLIPKWGIAGAAFASTVAYWADTLVVLIAFMNISKKSAKEVLIIKKQDFRDYKKMFLIVWRRGN